MRQRIDRHKKTDKKCFWHIDYVLTEENVQIQDISVISQNPDRECSENKKLLMGNASIVAKGFGAADAGRICFILELKLTLSDPISVYMIQQSFLFIKNFITWGGRIIL